MARVELSGLSRSYGPVTAVSGLSLEVPDGALLCLLGPSGSGKTTTMRMIAGLETPDSGTITVGDRNVTSLEPRERRVGMMFQGYALYPHMKVGDNIAYPLRVRGVPKQERAERVREVARLLEIEAQLDRPPAQISGGQAQRVALARAIVQRPDVYLLDEPISSLDASLRSTMRGVLKRLQRQLGATSIVVSHDQLDALAMADLVAVLSQGKLQQLGTPDEIYGRPANVFVARFMGDPPMNLVPAELERQDGCLGVRLCGHWIPVSPDAARALAEITSPGVTVGIRPRAIKVGSQAGPGLVPAKVFVVAPEGSRVVYDLQASGQLFKAEADSRLELSLDDEVQLELPPQNLHFFAAEPMNGLNRGDRIA